MLELLILWNIAAMRDDAREDNDLTVGPIAVWIVLQLFIWPISLFTLLWRRAGVRWPRALIATAVVVVWGTWLGGWSFYWVAGFAAVFAAACVVAHAVTSDT